MMKKLLFVILVFSASVSFSQDKKRSDSTGGYDRTNLFVGGSLSLSVGGYSNAFLIGLNPYVGYTFKKWIDAGVIVNYQHYAEKDEYRNKYRSNTIGGGVFTRIYPVDVIFIQAQPEYNFITQKLLRADQPTIREHRSAPSLLVGAGYKSSRHEKNTFTFLCLMVDVIKDINSPYVDGDGDIIPVIRAGINVGLGNGKIRR